MEINIFLVWSRLKCSARVFICVHLEKETQRDGFPKSRSGHAARWWKMRPIPIQNQKGPESIDPWQREQHACGQWHRAQFTFHGLRDRRERFRTTILTMPFPASSYLEGVVLWLTLRRRLIPHRNKSGAHPKSTPPLIQFIVPSYL